MSDYEMQSLIQSILNLSPTTITYITEWMTSSGATSAPQQLPPVVTLDLFKLYDLPEEYITLTELNTRCERCDTEPSSPALCLLCGKILCAASPCCGSEDGVGECSQHTKLCGGSSGLYLLLNKGILMLVFDGIAGMYMTPYLDPFGEEDIGFKRGLPLRLNGVRYKQLQDIIVTHSLGTKIILEPLYSARDKL